MLTSDESSKKALAANVFKGSAEELIAATKAIAGPMSKLTVSSANATELLDLLLARADKVK